MNLNDPRFTEFTPCADLTRLGGRLLHLGLCGSVAAYRLCDVARAWLGLGIHVSGTLTSAAARFISPLLLRSLGLLPVYEPLFADGDEPFAHLEPGQQAHAMMVAPASADFLARMAQGRAGDMLAAQALSFDGPIWLAPAMNPRMWKNPATAANIALLLGRGHRLLDPGSGGTACGDEGVGRLAPQPALFLAGLAALAPKDMAGKKVLVTIGPTREYWDGVRYFSNPSSGRMGCALAAAAWLRGASVRAVCGPGVNFYLPGGVERINVLSAAQMHEAAAALWPEMDIGIFCAAVADFAPVRPAEPDKKFKKQAAGRGLEITMIPNRDILADLAKAARPDQRILGFAAETAGDCVELGRLAALKLRRKGADLMAANSVLGAQGAFGARSSSLAVADRTGREEIWEEQNKDDAAWDLLTWLLGL